MHLPQEKSRKGLALRDITNQTPLQKPLTGKKSVKKVLKKNHVIKESQIEYMPSNVEPIEFKDEKYKIDLKSIKPTSRGCQYIKEEFKIDFDQAIKFEEIKFSQESENFDAEVDDSFLYFS